METSALIAIVLGLVGLSDIVIARLLADRLPAMARTALTIGGIAFLVAAGLFAARIIRI